MLTGLAQGSPPEELAGVNLLARALDWRHDVRRWGRLMAIVLRLTGRE
jgi:hypothetical protein